MDLEAVARAIRHAESEEIAPRFRRLRDGDVEEKSPGEVVTAADRGCEELLTSLLRDIRDIPVVGEEAAATDPELVERIATSREVWLVDPLDGTANFAAGSTDYAVMVAHVRSGHAAAGWIWRPTTRQMFVAERGAGSYANGVRVHGAPPAASPGTRSGIVKERFLPNEIRTRVLANERRVGRYVPGPNCAGVEYPALVAGDIDFALYWRTLPWDHAPGVLYAEEAGFRALRPDGEDYRCGSNRAGLVIAHRDHCATVRASLLD